jgi:O-antigen ligase
MFIFFNFYFFRKEFKKIIAAIISPILFNIPYKLFMIVNKEAFIDIAGNIVYSGHFSIVLSDFERGRLYIDTYDEAIIPFLLLTSVVRVPFLRYLFILVLAFLGFISNWRIRALMIAFSLISSLFMKTLKIKTLVILIFAVLIVGWSASYVSTALVGFSVVDRLTFTYEDEDIESLNSRLNQINIALQMGQQSLFGVGLGNYYDNLRGKDSAFYSDRDVKERTLGNIHNIFAAAVAETGYIGLLLLIGLLFVFAKNDMNILNTTDRHRKACVVSFWTIFFHILLAPNTGGYTLVFFWGIRGLLLRPHKETK